MPEQQQVRCPRCHRKQPHRGPGAIYWCTHCHGQFDDDPDEGGSHWNDPTKRAEKTDERRVYRRNGRSAG